MYLIGDLVFVIFPNTAKAPSDKRHFCVEIAARNGGRSVSSIEGKEWRVADELKEDTSE